MNDKQITDHYAIIPTGQGFGALGSLKGNAYGVYAAIVRRFLSIFYPPVEFAKITMVTAMQNERFFYSFRVLLSEGYFKVAGNPYEKEKEAGTAGAENEKMRISFKTGSEENQENSETVNSSKELLELLKKIRKGMEFPIKDLVIREGETAPPKRYNSGSMILAMENAGQLIEDEELRAQIKSCGIGTSATQSRNPEEAGGKQIHRLK